MLLVISPSKKLEFENAPNVQTYQPRFMEETKALVDIAKQLTQAQLMELMSISYKLAELNYHRFRQFTFPFTPQNSKAAIYAFKGDVYDGLEAENLKEANIAFAQKHLRILSGLYGVLRPLDAMQPYRLEMGIALKNPKGKNLYQFWGDKIRHLLEEDLKAQSDDVLINLASNEYFKAVQPKALKARIITPGFKEHKNGKYKMLMIYAKRARGAMARYIIEHNITDPEKLKKFDVDGYAYNAELSNGDDWVFTRG